MITLFPVHYSPGSPSQTGVGTLIVNLMDINDNYPTFAQDYLPVIYENEPPGRTVAIITAIDKDTASNGPPFEMWLPCGGSCPCRDNPVCGLFDFKFEAGRSYSGNFLPLPGAVVFRVF